MLKKELQSLLFVRNFNSFAVVVAVIAFCAEFQFFCCGCCCYSFLCGISILLLWLLLLLLFVPNFNSFAVIVAVVIAFCAKFQFFCCGCCCGYCFCWHASIAKFNVWKIAKISKISNCVPRSLVYQTNFGEVRSRSNKEHISRDEKLDKYHKWRQSKKLFFR